MTRGICDSILTLTKFVSGPYALMQMWHHYDQLRIDPGFGMLYFRPINHSLIKYKKCKI